MSQFSGWCGKALAILTLAGASACDKPNVFVRRDTANTSKVPSAAVHPVPIADSDIREAVAAEFHKDKKIDQAGIRVAVENGVVALNGKLDNLLSKGVGVTLVKNELVAQSHDALPDRELAARVKEALLFDPMTEAQDIAVTVKEGHIGLAGSVGTFFESAEAFDVASRLTGATQVDDELQVKETRVPYVYSPYVDPFTSYVETWHAVSPRPVETDSTIASHIQAEFSRSPFINPPDVHVKVVGGNVTLTGVVGTLRERRAAARNALESGAVAVENQLNIG